MNLVVIGAHALCPQCKPAYIQAIREGGKPPSAGTLVKGVYQYNWNGHQIKFEHVCTYRTLWLASHGYLYIDGKLAAPPPNPFSLGSTIAGTLLHENEPHTVQLQTKTSGKVLFGLLFKLSIDGEIVDEGELPMIFRIK